MLAEEYDNIQDKSLSAIHLELDKLVFKLRGSPAKKMRYREVPDLSTPDEKKSTTASGSELTHV